MLGSSHAVEQGEGDQVLGLAEAEGHAVEHPQLGVGALDQGVEEIVEHGLWVPRIHPPSSGGDPVLMDEAAEPVGSSHPGEVDIAEERGSRIERGWRPLVQRAMRALGVVMLDVLDEYGLHVATAEYEHSVEALAPDAADHAFADGVGPGCLDRGLDDGDALGGEDRVERSRVRGVAITNEELDRSRGRPGPSRGCGPAGSPSLRLAWQ